MKLFFDPDDPRPWTWEQVNGELFASRGNQKLSIGQIWFTPNAAQLVHALNTLQSFTPTPAASQPPSAAIDELMSAAAYAIQAMQNMRQGTFRGATARLRRALDAVNTQTERNKLNV